MANPSSVDRFLVTSSPVFASGRGADTMTVLNAGGQIVYYGAANVSSSVNAGSIAAGVSQDIAGGYYLATAAGVTSNVIVTVYSASGGAGATIVTTGTSIAATPGTELMRTLWAPTDVASSFVLSESTPRAPGPGAQTASISNAGVMYAVGLVVPAGRTVDSMTFVSAGTGASGITNYFFALVKASDLSVLAKSADSSAAWAGNTIKTLNMAAPWTATADTAVYACVSFVGTTAPTLTATATHIQSINRTPVVAGTTGTTAANAAALGASITGPIVQAAAGTPYASVNSLTNGAGATVGEGLLCSSFPGTIASSGAVSYICSAPAPIIVRSCYVTVMSGNVTSSDTDYWTVELGRERAGVYANIASKTTQATGGEAMFNLQPWAYDAVVFDTTNQILLKNDVLVLKSTKTLGAPGNITSPGVTIRYTLL